MIQVIIGILVLIASVLLVLVVMVQNSKGGGLDASFSAVNQIGNVAQSTDIVEKGTWYLAGFIGFLCLLSAFNLGSDKGTMSTNTDGFKGGSVPTEMPAP